MPDTLDPIVTSTELTSYLSGDPDLYVTIASDVVRGYCHWHIWPEIKENRNLVGSGSMQQPLRTLKAVAVDNLVVDGQPWEPYRYDLVPAVNQISAKRLYHDLSGYLDYVEEWSDSWRWGYNRFPKGRPITVDLTHGFKDPPGALKAVVLNLAARAQAMPSTWLRMMQSDVYRYEFVSGLLSHGNGPGGGAVPAIGGFQLTADDCEQLTAFWMPGIA